MTTKELIFRLSQAQEQYSSLMLELSRQEPEMHAYMTKVMPDMMRPFDRMEKPGDFRFLLEEIARVHSAAVRVGRPSTSRSCNQAA